MIPVDLVEQVQPQALQPVGADAGKDGIALGGKIGLKKGVREIAHDQARASDMVPKAYPIAPARHGGDQLVRAPAQPQQLGVGGRSIRWLVEPGALGHQKLVGANHQHVRIGDVPGLRVSQP